VHIKNLDKSRFFLRDWFVVLVKCAFERAFPGNIIASTLRHGAKCQKYKINKLNEKIKLETLRMMM